MGGNIPFKLIFDILGLLKSVNSDPEIRKYDHKDKVKMAAVAYETFERFGWVLDDEMDNTLNIIGTIHNSSCDPFSCSIVSESI